MLENKHYILTKEDDCIIDGWSDGLFPKRDTSQAICINEHGSYQFRLIFHQLITTEDGESKIEQIYSEENPSLFDDEGLPIYKYENEEIVKLTEVEKNLLRIKRDNKNLPSIKLELIAQSKNELSQFLSNHPLKWTDNKLYSVTQEKQALLMGQLALYHADSNAILYWNASGEPNKEWTITELSKLAIAISDYVQPYVQYQQNKELQINTAETAEEARAIQIDYDSLS